MKILVDCDDTIWNLLDAWVDILNKRYDKNVKSEDVLTWDMSITYSDLEKYQIYEPLCEEELWKSVKPKFDAIKYIAELCKKGHEIYFVTTTDYRNIQFKIDLIKTYFPDVPIENVIITYHKDMIIGDILIDDYINNFKNRTNGILFTAPYNKEIDVSKFGLHRCNNWEEIYEYIDKIKPV